MHQRIVGDGGNHRDLTSAPGGTRRPLTQRGWTRLVSIPMRIRVAIETLEPLVSFCVAHEQSKSAMREPWYACRT
jgi:hypothetical protein